MTLTVTSPLITQQYRVQKIKRETHDTFILELEPAKGKDGFHFAPGQFNMLYAFGVGEVPISISGDPTDPSRLVHTIRAIGAVTRALCGMAKGSIVGIRGPFGSGWPVEEVKGNDVVLVTGGIGLAPLRPAIYSLLANREEYGNIVILYGARSPSEMLYTKELEKWRGRFDLDVRVTVDTAPGGWRGNVALVTSLIPKIVFDPISTVAFVCGPEIMMRFTIEELHKRDVEDRDIYISMERNIRCGIGHCGHCQLGPYFICKDGPVFRFENVRRFFEKREI